jgi:SAM-dependent MidA family methyltransferase
MALQGELALDESQARHAGRVREHIASCIERAGGWISFERFMDLALYAPGLGYYSAGARKLGAGGDFTTAPEISALYGACLARQCGEVIGDRCGATVLEVGAGSGRLAADLLARLETLHSLPATYAILEVSADLRERQRDLIAKRLPHLLERVEWLEAPPAAPFDGVVIANEVLDALPVSRFRWHPTHVEELGVAFAAEEFVARDRPASAELTAVCRRLLAAAGGAWADGYESEYCGRLPAFTREVTRALRVGAVLWIDYGLPRREYYLPERRAGTFLCHFRQRAHEDAFLCPGLQDMTAWVDYTSLAESGRDAGFSIDGFATQAHLLAALGIDEEMRSMAAGRPAELARLGLQARRLMMPGEMGERFKAMAWSRGLDAPLRGFSLQDLRHTL